MDKKEIKEIIHTCPFIRKRIT